MTVMRGGKAVYGASVGILLLESRFPRIPGDGGHAGTWPFPVLYRVVPGATPDRVVRAGAEGVVEEFAAAARELAETGADGITTNCGFLVLHQDRLARACGVPVAASSLLQVPWVERLLAAGSAGRRADGGRGQPDATASRMRRCATGHPGRRDPRAARSLPGCCSATSSTSTWSARGKTSSPPPAGSVERHRDIGAIVLECTNMPPYAADVSRAVGLPVYDFYSFVCWFQAGLRPRAFDS